MFRYVEYSFSSALGTPEMVTLSEDTSISVASPPALSTLPSHPGSNIFGSEGSVGFESAERIIDKPPNDGYKWRKYGQKELKGAKYPKCYYKCTGSKCPAKKTVEHSEGGQVSQITYLKQHNHSLPNELNDLDGSQDFNSSGEQSVTSDDAMGGVEANGEDADDNNLTTGRRNLPTAQEVILQTISNTDVLDDGYRWRKYGQKVMKGNPNPRSYYRCAFQGCHVTKHIQRSAAEPKAVITAYRGKHNHDVPTSWCIRKNG